MEKIRNFENCKIENLSQIYGGRQTVATGLGGDDADKLIHYDNGDWKRIENLGFGNWLNGDRKVTTGQFAGYDAYGSKVYNTD
jgi:hypothetical protein